MVGTTRRGFIAGLGATSLVGLAPGIATARHEAAVDAGANSEPEFLGEPGLIHLNTATLGLVPRQVRDRVIAPTRLFESNPVPQGYKLADDTVLGQAEQARAHAAVFLNCSTDELMITHGTADGLGQVAASIDFRAGDRILTSSAEHDSGVLCWRWLARRHGGSVDVVPLAPEETDADAIVQRFAQAMRPTTKVICVSDVIAWTGLRMPIRALADLAHAHGALMVVDGAQAVGHVPVDVVALGCDAYAGSGHKWLLGPKGSGLLYVRQDAAQRIFPVAWEDGQRLNKEAMGCCPLPQAIGLGAAIEHYQRRGPAAELARNAELRDQLHASLQRIKGLVPVGPPPGAQPTALLGVRLPDAVDSTALRKRLLDNDRINVRTVDAAQWNGLRMSVHVYNDEAQLDVLAGALRRELG